ncbi:MAG: hypothetical protein JWL75_803 [Parcubacteria group bacterium]|nr:hypothetical protein [Parcubacteria group bacterium]
MIKFLERERRYVRYCLHRLRDDIKAVRNIALVSLAAGASIGLLAAAGGAENILSGSLCLAGYFFVGTVGSMLLLEHVDKMHTPRQPNYAKIFS